MMSILTVFKRLFLPLAGMLLSSTLLAGPDTLSLAGQWRFSLDPSDVGIKNDWCRRALPDRIQLPGVLQSQGYGNEISTNTPWVLSLYDRFWFLRADYQDYARPGNVRVPFVCQPPRHFLGAAWYQTDIRVPENWRNRRVWLRLERARWETTVWVDDRRIGSNNSLVAPHDYELGFLPPGRHQLTVRVDNRMLLPYRPDAHSVSDSLNSTWNGITGAIELHSTTPVWIDSIRAFPDITNHSVRLEVKVGNITGSNGVSTLSANDVSTPVAWTADGGHAKLVVDLGARAELWDEFNPELHKIKIRLAGGGADDQTTLMTGLSEFKAVGRDFVINGRKVHLRGTHHGGDFPLTGYPPSDLAYWRDLFQTCKKWGLNHMRFHSWCPPEAAFTAADEAGFYLQPEPGMWNEINAGSPNEKMLYEETERMLKAYGNHPSFVLFSASNEPKGQWKKTLPLWVEHFRTRDPRRIYTTGTGWSLIDRPGPVTGADYLAVHRIGSNMLRGNTGWFGWDYSDSARGVNVPIVTHEVGQWCAYPDYDIIRKFTGYMRPGNFEIFRDSMAAHGLLQMDRAFAWASGRFQLECYKEEIEANLRSQGVGGFQLLDLHDYVGQGTALVGVLDPFWEEKGYVTAKEWRRFCDVTVPLARLERRIFTTTNVFSVPVEAAHYGPTPFREIVAAWRIENAKGRTVAHGKLPPAPLPLGSAIPLGTLNADLSALPAPGAYKLVVRLQGTRFENDWNFWLYPASAPEDAPADVFVTRSWDDAESRLAAGGKVLYMPRSADLDWTSPPLDKDLVFWNRLMNPGWTRMLGLWCDKHHPALAGFPTEENCDWQWARLLRNARAVNMDRLPPTLQPVVQGIDDWNRNWKLGILFECRVGTGRLMVSAINLDPQSGLSSAARQLRRSLLDYMSGRKFKPVTVVTPGQIRQFLFDTTLMRKLEATARLDGSPAPEVIDGNPNTSSSVSSRESRHPHELTIAFPGPVMMKGLVLMNRQNDRDHLGDIRQFVIQASDDGDQWSEILRGELQSTWNPQEVRFPQAVTARHIKLTALSGFGTDTGASLAELSVIYAGPRLPELESGDVEYRRTRSTSTDVDEGAAPARPVPAQ